MGHGQLLKPLPPSGFMYPIGRINNASLIRDPPPTSPLEGWGTGKQSPVQAIPSQPRFALQINMHRNVFIVKNLFSRFIKDAANSIFSSVLELQTLNQSGIPCASKAYVTDTLLSSKIGRWQLAWISIWGHIAFINVLLFFPRFSSCNYFHHFVG